MSVDEGKNQRVPGLGNKGEKDHHKKSAQKVVYIPKKEMKVQERFITKSVKEVQEFHPISTPKDETKEKKLNIKASSFAQI